MWDGYDHPELAEQTELVEKLPNGNFRHLPITREQMAAIVIALRWSLQNINDFELTEKDDVIEIRAGHGARGKEAKTQMTEEKWVKVGTIPVDSGMVCLCDPLHAEKLGKDIREAFMSGLYSHLMTEYGVAGQVDRGCLSEAGYGDGAYDVEVRLVPGMKGWGPEGHERVAELRIKFLP